MSKLKQLGVTNKDKFYIHNNTRLWSYIALCLSLLIYILMLLLTTKKGETVGYGWYVVRDVSLLVFTILGTTILTGRFLETESRNNLYDEAILLDVLSNPAFYSAFSEEIQSEMWSALEKARKFPKNQTAQGMYATITNRLLQAEKSGYYCTEAILSLTCNINEDNHIFQNHCELEMRVKSYEDMVTVENFPLLQVSEIDAGNFVSISVKRADALITENCVYSPSSDKHSSLFTLDRLELSADTETVIVIEFDFIPPLNSNASSFRYHCLAPCQTLKVDAYIEEKGYQLAAEAFGCPPSKINYNLKAIHMTFNDWVFYNDGVVIHCMPNLSFIKEDNEILNEKTSLTKITPLESVIPFPKLPTK